MYLKAAYYIPVVAMRSTTRMCAVIQPQSLAFCKMVVYLFDHNGIST